MFENIIKFFKKTKKKEDSNSNSKDTAKERLHLVLMQDRANVSADFLDLMRQEIVEVIKKYIDIDEDAMDVRLTNQENEDGTQGAPALYANIPIVNIKDEVRKIDKQEKNIENSQITENNKLEDNKEVDDTQKEETTSNNTESNEDKTDEKNTKKEESNDESKKIEEHINNNENKDIAENKSEENNKQRKDNTKNNENKKKTEDDKK